MNTYCLSVREKTKLPALGRCAYCGSQEKLTKEHIIPYAIAGDFLTCDESSCQKCAKITGKDEGTLCRLGLDPFRTHRNFPSRRPKKTKVFMNRFEANVIASDPLSGQVKLKISDGPNPYRSELIPVDIAHKLLVLPRILEPPRVFLGFLDGTNTEITLKDWIFDSETSRKIKSVNKSSKPSTLQVVSSKKFKELYIRLMAKIAHCFTVCTLGEHIYEVELFLKDSIVGDGSLSGHYIGGACEFEPPSQERNCVDIFAVEVKQNTYTSRFYLVCRIRLFGDFGAPTYDVVVGEIKNFYSFFMSTKIRLVESPI